MNKQVAGNNYRFTVITDQLIRMEYQPEGKFEDRPTQTVINREFGEPEAVITKDDQGFVVQIETSALHLYYRGGDFNGENLFVDSKYNYKTHYNRWHFGDYDKGNLLGTARTLDHADGAIPLEEGVISKSGFAILDDSKSMIQEGTAIENRTSPEIDLYEFAYGHDYQGAIHDYYQLTGFPPLIPRFALGNWWSRFYPYTQESYANLMTKFDAEKIPINVAVFDMNWHTTDIPSEYMSGWTGYTWNRKLFPHPEQLLTQLHDEGRHVTLNVHPAAGIRPSEEQYPAVANAVGIDPKSKQPVLFDLNNRKFVSAYFDLVHHPLEQQGVDFWWLDWQQGGSRSAKQIDPLWALNVLHYTDAEKKHSNQAMIMSRYAGPGSHRYPIGFSGDTVASWASLKFQPYFTATASNIGYTWWSHDIGGHMHGVYDPQLSLRWLQFGVFSPIMRLHSSDNIFMGKEPWNYDEATHQAMNKFLRLRSALVPYLQTANVHTHEDGVALIRPLYYAYPDVSEAYANKNEYLFGSEMIVIPITSPADKDTSMSSTTGYVPEGTWTDFFTGESYVGPATVKFNRYADEYPVLVKSGGIVPLNVDYMSKIDELPVHLDVHLYPGNNNEYTLVEQCGEKTARTTFNWKPSLGKVSVNIDDAEGILPSEREITFTQEPTKQQIKIKGKSEDVQTVTVPEVDPQLVANLKHERILRIIQHAKMGFDLKDTIWNAIQAQTPMRAAQSVQSLTPNAIAEAVLEVLLSE